MSESWSRTRPGASFDRTIDSCSTLVLDLCGIDRPPSHGPFAAVILCFPPCFQTVLVRALAA